MQAKDVAFLHYFQILFLHCVLIPNKILTNNVTTSQTNGQYASFTSKADEEFAALKNSYPRSRVVMRHSDGNDLFTQILVFNMPPTSTLLKNRHPQNLSKYVFFFVLNKAKGNASIFSTIFKKIDELENLQESISSSNNSIMIHCFKIS